MKLLVTGGAGFIGSNFILYWLENHPKDSIVNLDLLTYAGNLENLSSIENNSNYSFIQGDICDPFIVDKATENVDVIVHFAAESHVDRSILEPDAFIRTNVLGTQVLLEAARKKKIRFHHVSTDEVFGSLELNSDEKFTVNTSYDPSSPYSASKAGSDHLVRAYSRTYDLPITITNCSNNYGPYQFPEKLIPLVITNALENKPIPVYGTGNQVRDWLHVEDHCRAIDLVLTKGELSQTYLVGGLTHDITNLSVIKKILEFVGKSEELIQFVKDRAGHDERYAVDWSGTHEKLGYTPKHDFDTYLRTTVEWYTTHQNWWKRVKSGEYQKYYETQYSKK